MRVNIYCIHNLLNYNYELNNIITNGKDSKDNKDILDTKKGLSLLIYNL
jgi:hypothetical protein